jgi:fatty acid desaturase
LRDLLVRTTDPHWVKPASYSWFERALLRVVKDERDLLFAKVIFWASVILVPFAVLMVVLPSWLTLLLAVPYLATVYMGFGGRYMLLLHALCHRPTFTREFRWLHTWFCWVLGPLFGSTPTSFFAHHIGMHHPENNMEEDLSSTLPYQRDRFVHFLHYWGRFFLFGYLHVPRYLRLRGRAKLYRSFLLGEISWVLAAAALLYFDWAAGLVVLVVPLCLLRWFMMCGNFAQHAFVDIDDAANPYRNSTCLINVRYNHKCYNDGYHIVHHIKPGLHWLEMPEWFEEHIEEFARQDAIVFDGLGNNQRVWWLLMSGQYDVLAQHMMNFRDRTLEERVQFLKDRVQRRRGELKSFFAQEPEPIAAG